MKYILGLIFEYHHYKRPSYLKIFTSDMLIDDIKLSSNIVFNGYEQKDSSWLNYVPTTYFKNVPELGYLKNPRLVNKCFLYEIDETALGDKMVFKMTNDNNNYTNGFMTKFAYINFQSIFLIPKDYFVNLETLGDKGFLGNNPDNERALLYPSDLRIYDEKEKKWTQDFFEIIRGDSFVLELPIKYMNEMHMFMPRSFPSGHIEWQMSSTFLNYYAHTNLLNIYNENQ